jgi:lactoylglutathione lyase
MGGVEINLVVARTADLARARRFYESIGLTFTDEQHGTGPAHLAATDLSGVVFELYPTSASGVVERGTAGDVRLGFRVPSASVAAEAAVLAGGAVVGEVTAADGVERAVVTDPDGRRVELTSSTP